MRQNDFFLRFAGLKLCDKKLCCRLTDVANGLPNCCELRAQHRAKLNVIKAGDRNVARDAVSLFKQIIDCADRQFVAYAEQRRGRPCTGKNLCCQAFAFRNTAFANARPFVMER